MLHFLMTTVLYWTRFPSVSIGLPANYSKEKYEEEENAYLTVISLGLIFLLGQFVMLPVHYEKLYFRNVINLALDIAAIFFNFWIAFDGLHWHTYVFIFIFCV